MTSASHPDGISNTAYDRANALSTRAICAFVRCSSSEMYGAAAEMQTRSRYVMTAIRKPNQRSVTRARDAERVTAGMGTTRIVAELLDGHRCERARQSAPASAAVPVPALRRVVSGPDQRRLRRAADEHGPRLLGRDLFTGRRHLLSRLHAARDPEQRDPRARRR